MINKTNFKNKICILSLLFFVLNLSCLYSANNADDENTLINLLNETISTASKYEQNVHEAPASVSIISSEDIVRYGYKTLAELLTYVRSFYMRNDLNYQYAGVRGFELPSSYNNKVLLLLDGHILNDNIYNSAYFGHDLGVDMNIVDHVEIVRGPGSSLYGAGAMLAVINVITKSAKTVNGLNATVSYGNLNTTEIKLNYGKNITDDFSLVISGLAGKSDGFNYYFDEFDTPDQNNGNAVNLDWEKYYGGFLNAAFKDFSLTAYFADRSKGVPTAPWSTIFNDNKTSTVDQRYFVNFSYDTKIDPSKTFSCKMSYDGYNYKGNWAYDTLQYDQNTGRWFGLDLYLTWDIFNNNRLIMGGELKHNTDASYKLWDDYSVLFDNNYPYDLYSVYFQDTYQAFEDLQLMLGLRGDFYTYDVNALSPRVALVYYISQNTDLKLIYNEAFRAPNIYEMYYLDYQSQIPNPDLLPEKINTYELVLEHDFNKNYWGSISFYNYNFTNLIVDETDTSNGFQQFRNIDKSSGYGIESECKARFDNGMQGFISYCYQFSKNDNTGEKLVNSPSNILKAAFSTIIWDQLSVGVNFYGESERKTLQQNVTQSYFITNLCAKYSINLRNDIDDRCILNKLDLEMKINNVFDNKYYLPGGWEHIQNEIQQNRQTYVLQLMLSL